MPSLITFCCFSLASVFAFSTGERDLGTYSPRSAARLSSSFCMVVSSDERARAASMAAVALPLPEEINQRINKKKNI